MKVGWSWEIVWSLSTKRNHISSKIDIILRCKPFPNPHCLDYIWVCQGYFDVGLHLPTSALVVQILNYIEFSPTNCLAILMCLWVLTELDKHYGSGVVSLGQFEHNFRITKSVSHAHMYLITKRDYTSLIFKNPNKREYTDNWIESGKYYEGDDPLAQLSANKRITLRTCYWCLWVKYLLFNYELF